jgi:hypothetical protein
LAIGPELIKFEPKHLLEISRREDKPEERVNRDFEAVKRYHNLAYTGIVDGRILGSAGMFIGLVYRDGGKMVNDSRAGYAWVVVSEEIGNYKLWFHRIVGMYFKAVIRTFRLNRVECEVMEDSARNRRWAEVLGFRPADPVEKAVGSDGVVYLRYVRETECRDSNSYLPLHL